MTEPGNPAPKPRRPRPNAQADLSIIMGLGILAFFIAVGFMLNIGPRDGNQSTPAASSSSPPR